MDNEYEGVLRIANESDRVDVASILYKNGYKISPCRKKINGKTYEQYLAYSKVDRGFLIKDED